MNTKPRQMMVVLLLVMGIGLGALVGIFLMIDTKGPIDLFNKADEEDAVDAAASMGDSLGLLEGEWVLVKATVNGEERVRVANKEEVQMVISGREMRLRHLAGGRERVELWRIVKISLGPPATIDLHLEGSEVPMLAIYEVKGDRLSLCCSLDETGRSRPKEFRSEPHSRTTLLVFQRKE